MHAHDLAPEGDLADTPLAKLLAAAFVDGTSGTIIVEERSGKLAAARFLAGALVQVSGFWQSVALERGALSMFLPPDSLAFVSEHAKRYGLDGFTAVGQLALLPEESLRLAVEAYFTRGIEKLSEDPGLTKYRFRPGTEKLKGTPTLNPGIVPVSLVISSLQVDPRVQLDTQIEDFGDQVFLIAQKNVGPLRACLTGPARAVAESIARGGKTFEALDALALVPRARLGAIVYGLCLAGQVVATKRRSGVSSAPPSGAQKVAQEQALEAKVMEAWALAETDPSRVDKASQFADKAVSVFPNNARLRFFSARLHRHADRLEQAKSQVKTALVLDPNHVEAKRELALLDRMTAESGGLFGKR